jgi:hypothetical protein
MGLLGVRDRTGLRVVREGTELFLCPKKQLCLEAKILKKTLDMVTSLALVQLVPVTDFI